MSNNKPSHYQIQQILKQGEEIGLTKEQIFQAAPNLEKYYDSPNAIVSGLQNAVHTMGEMAGDITDIVGTGVEAVTGWDGMNRAADSIDGAYQKHVPRVTYHSEQYEKEDFNLANLYGFAVSEAPSSLVHTLGAMNPYTMPAYLASQTNRVAEERATADGREGNETGEDYLFGLGGGLANTALERIGGKFMLPKGGDQFVSKNVDEAGDLLGYTSNDKSGLWSAGENFVKGGIGEGATEFAQEGSEYVFTNAGTETGANWQDGLEQAGTGALLGGMIGSHTAGAKTGYDSVTRGKLADKMTVDLLEQNQSTALPDDNPIMQSYMSEEEANSFSGSNLPFDNRENSPLGGNELEELAIAAVNVDPELAQYALDYPENGLKVQALNDIIGQTENYKKARNNLDIHNARKQAEQEAQGPALNEEAVTSALAAHEEQLQRQDIQPNPETTKLQLSGVRQSLRAERENRKSKFGEHATTEKTLARKRLISSFKNKTKKYTKKIKQAKESKDFDLRYAKAIKARQEEVKAIEFEQLKQAYEDTKLAREYRMAEDLGIEKEFSAMHLAIVDALGDTSNKEDMKLANDTMKEFVETETQIEQELNSGDSRLDEHTTRSGNSVVGQILNITKDEALEADPHAVPKGDGWFVSRDNLAKIKSSVIKNSQNQAAPNGAVSDLGGSTSQPELETEVDTIGTVKPLSATTKPNDIEYTTDVSVKNGVTTTKYQFKKNGKIGGKGHNIPPKDFLNKHKIEDAEVVNEISSASSIKLIEKRESGDDSAVDIVIRTNDGDISQTINLTPKAKTESNPKPSMEDDHIYMTPLSGGGVIVKGDTYQNKEKIKAAGGKWDSSRKGWKFDNEATASQFVNSDGDTFAKSNAVKVINSAFSNGHVDGDEWVNSNKRSETTVEVVGDRIIIGRTSKIGRKTNEVEREYSHKEVEEFLSDDANSIIGGLRARKDGHLDDEAKAEQVEAVEDNETELLSKLINILETFKSNNAVYWPKWKSEVLPRVSKSEFVSPNEVADLVYEIEGNDSTGAFINGEPDAFINKLKTKVSELKLNQDKGNEPKEEPANNKSLNVAEFIGSDKAKALFSKSMKMLSINNSAKNRKEVLGKLLSLDDDDWNTSHIYYYLSNFAAGNITDKSESEPKVKAIADFFAFVINDKVLGKGVNVRGVEYQLENAIREHHLYAEETKLDDLVSYDSEAIKQFAKEFADLPINDDIKAELDKKADTKPANTESTLYRSLYKAIESGDIPKNNIQLKKFIAKEMGKEFSAVTRDDEKLAQEQFEAAMTAYARKFAEKNKGNHKKIVDMLSAKYESQPKLEGRSVQSTKNMAYSTPSAISYLANQVTGINNDVSVYEPTAGNGLLLITNNMDQTHVNELDPKRVKQLEWLGYKNISTLDATENSPVKAKSQDVVIMNPPFGKFDKPLIAKSVDGLEYKLDDLDHVIAAKQLETMKDNGNAVIIMGANKEAGIVRGGKTGRFMNWLYANYNVVDHVELDGKVYTKQGASWPIRVITIHGRENTGEYAPADGSITRLSGDNATDIINKLYERYEQSGLLGTSIPATGSGKGTSDSDLQTTSGTDNNAESNPQSGQAEHSNSTGENEAGGPSRVPTGNNGTGTGPDNGSSSSNGNDNDSNISGPTNVGTGLGESSVEKPSLSNQSESSNRVESGRSTKHIVDRLTAENDSRDNDFQSNYIPASNGFNDGVLTPVNMAGKTRKALAKLVNKVGDLDAFVANELGYESIKDVHKSLMALQVDAVAMAIDKIKNKKAIIVADQTGVGKGRQAASVIRYALKNGKIPVFVTQKANLFSDMYGDLLKIGSDDVKPFLFNNGESIVMDEKKSFKSTQTIRSAGLKDLAAGKMPMVENGQQANALFLTYDQISKAGKQQDALNAIAENAIFILDEAHSASGRESGRGVFMRSVLGQSQGAMYLSATFAKRPDNLGLYHLTSLGDAVESMEELEDALIEGGLQVQTLVSSMFTEEGELFRRERTFEGISIANAVDKDNYNEHVEKFDKSTDILRDIVVLGKGFVDFIKSENKKNKDGSEYSANTNIDKMNPFMFSSQVHNYISSLTLAVKAESAANKAIESFKSGQKPVIALENTLESKLEEFMSDNGVSIGGSVANFTFGDMFKGGLKNAISLSTKLPNGQSVHTPFDFDDLPSNLYSLYEKIQEKIDNTDLSDIPVSPIDFIRKKLQDEGIRVAEVTGRGKMVDYNDNMIVKNKPKSEQKVNRKSVIDGFNSGKTDALILNQSGSTGLSIHASEEVKDQKPRHMIVAQPSLDINTFMQMLGRINRTGQVILPSYDLLWLALPSENRPATIVSNKMKGLNANTSANTDSATNVDSLDMFNQYGDEVVEAFLKENPSFLHEMAYSMPNEDIARNVTGKLALLSVERQEEFFAEVEPLYKDYIDHLKKTGEYALETQEVDLDAKPLEQTIAHKGGGKSVFDGDVKVTLSDVKRQGKPPKPEEAQEVLDNADAKAVSKTFEKAKEQFHDYIDSRFNKPIEETRAQLIKETDPKVRQALSDKIATLNEKRNKEEENAYEIEHLLKNRIREGSPIKIEVGDKHVTAVVRGVRHTHNGKGNPMSRSKFGVNMLTASGMGKMTMSLSQLNNEKLVAVNQVSRPNLIALFRAEYNRPQREERYIVTGNVIKAFSMTTNGRIVHFTKQGGGTEIGVLMNEGFTPEHISKREYAKDFSQVKRYLQNTTSELKAIGVKNKDGMLIKIKDGQPFVQLPAKSAKFEKKYLTDEVESIVGDLPNWKKGQAYVSLPVTWEQASQLFDIAKNHAPFALEGSVQEAFMQANGISDDTEVKTGTDIYFKTGEAATTKKKPKGITLTALEVLVDDLKATFQGELPNIVLAESQTELYGPTATVSNYGYIQGGYDSGQGAIGLVSSNLESEKEARKTLRHELVGHFGFQSLPTQQQKEIETRIINSPNLVVKSKLNEIRNDVAYKDLSESDQAQEVFAYLIEDGGSKAQNFIDSLLNIIQKGLKAMGLINKELVTKSELRVLAQKIAKGMNKPQPKPIKPVKKHEKVDESRRSALKFMGKMAIGAAVSGTVGATGRALFPENTVKFGKAKELNSEIYKTRLAPSVHDRIRITGDLHKVMKEAAKNAPKELLPLYNQLIPLLSDSNVSVRKVRAKTASYNGMFSFVQKQPMVTLMQLKERENDGMSHGTLLHEALHAVVGARYRTLSSGSVEKNYKLLQMDLPKNNKELQQLKDLWYEFRKAMSNELTPEEKKSMKNNVSFQEALGDPDEFFVRALTDPSFQLWLSMFEYKGKTLWDRFKDWVKRSLFKRTGVTPSWLDAALLGANELLETMQQEKGDFKFHDSVENFNKVEKHEGKLKAFYSHAGGHDHTTPPTPPSGGTHFRKKNKSKEKFTDKLAKEFNNAVNTWGLRSALQVVPINQMVDMFDHLANGAIDRYYNLLEDMAAYKQKAMSWADTSIEEKWDELQSGNPEASRRMSDVMLNATMAEVSPDKPLDQQTKLTQLLEKKKSLEMSIQGQRGNYSEKQANYLDSLNTQINDFKFAYNEISKDWKWLNSNAPDAVKLYKNVRRTYLAMWNRTKEHLVKRIEELETDERHKAALTAKIKLQFEGAITHGDYFPLKRFGDFAVTARKDGEYIREQYANQKEADKAAEQLTELGYDTAVRKMSDIFDNNEMNAFNMGSKAIELVKELESVEDPVLQDEIKSKGKNIKEVQQLVLDLQTQSNVEVDAVIDTIYQTMLQSLPQSSAAKSFIHRNRVKGASNDMRRAFAHSIFHSIQRSAKIQFEHKLQEQLNSIELLTKEGTGKDQHKLLEVHRTLKQRHDKTMNPDGSPLISQIAGLGFNYFLGGSIAAGIVNLSQVPLVALPFFAGKYGTRKTMSAMKYAFSHMRKAGLNNKGGLVKTLTQADSWVDLTHSKSLPKLERDLILTLQDRGKIDVTQAHSLSQIADTETKGEKGQNRNYVKIQRAWGFAFHNAEVVNRQVTALSAIKLAIESGVTDKDKLLALASKAIDETQFNYAGHNRGMAFRSDLGKLVFMFKTYVVNMILFMGKNFYRATNGDKQASKTFAVMMGVQFMAAGAIGLPLVEAIGEAIFAAKDMLDDDDEADDFKLWLDESIRYMAQNMGANENVSNFVSTVARKGPINAIFGINLADRVGLNNLIFRSEYKPESSPVESMADTLYSMSPVISILGNTGDGLLTMGDALTENDGEKFTKGVEKVLPIAIKNPVKAVRQYTMGQSTRSGTELINKEEFNEWNLLVQSIGFGTEKTRSLYESRGQQFKISGKAKLRKQSLMKKAGNLLESGEPLLEMTEEIKRFNKDNPTIAITVDGILKHVKNRELRNRLTKGGIYRSKKDQNQHGKFHYYDNQ